MELVLATDVMEDNMRFVTQSHTDGIVTVRVLPSTLQAIASTEKMSAFSGFLFNRPVRNISFLTVGVEANLGPTTGCDISAANCLQRWQDAR